MTPPIGFVSDHKPLATDELGGVSVYGDAINISLGVLPPEALLLDVSVITSFSLKKKSVPGSPSLVDWCFGLAQG